MVYVLDVIPSCTLTSFFLVHLPIVLTARA